MWSFSGYDMNTLLIMYAIAYCQLGNWIGAKYNTLSLYLETMSLFSLKLYSRLFLSVWNDLPYSVHVCSKLLFSVRFEQGTVTSMIQEKETFKGVLYKTRTGQVSEAHASLTIVCDGCFSNLRRFLQI